MKTRFKYLVSTVLLGALTTLTACGVALDNTPAPQERTFDGIKLIAAGVTDGTSPSMYGQSQYSISGTSRLLMRFEGLMDHVARIRADQNNPVRLTVVAASRDQAATVRLNSKVCPISRSDWMLLATWEVAHPFADSGKWTHPGGDFDPDGCATATPLDPAATDELEVGFDVTKWYLNYPEARQKNDGLILISPVAVTIYGEVSGTNAPKLSWSEVN